jgi:hypothetical protein
VCVDGHVASRVASRLGHTRWQVLAGLGDLVVEHGGGQVASQVVS